MSVENKYTKKTLEELKYQTEWEFFFFTGYYFEDIDFNEDIDAVMKKSDSNISKSIDSVSDLVGFSPEITDGLKKITASCGRLIAFFEGGLSFYLTRDRKSVVIVVETPLLDFGGYTRENFEYILNEASNVAIDASLNRGYVLLTVFYDLTK